MMNSPAGIRSNSPPEAGWRTSVGHAARGGGRRCRNQQHRTAHQHDSGHQAEKDAACGMVSLVASSPVGPARFQFAGRSLLESFFRVHVAQHLVAAVADLRGERAGIRIAGVLEDDLLQDRLDVLAAARDPLVLFVAQVRILPIAPSSA